MIELIFTHVISRVEGGISEGITELIARAIADAHFTEEEFYGPRELEYLEYIDANIFECEQCNWTMPIEEFSYDGYCTDCTGD